MGDKFKKESGTIGSRLFFTLRVCTKYPNGAGEEQHLITQKNRSSILLFVSVIIITQTYDLDKND